MSRFSTPTSMRAALNHANWVEEQGDPATADDIRHVVHVALQFMQANFAEHGRDLSESEASMLEEVREALR